MFSSLGADDLDLTALYTSSRPPDSRGPSPEPGGVPGEGSAAYAALCVRLFGALCPRPARLFRIPFLGVEPAMVPEEAVPLLVQPSVLTSSAHDRVVCALAQSCPPLAYAPQASSLTLILLQQLQWSEARTYLAMAALIRQSQGAAAVLAAAAAAAAPAPLQGSGEAAAEEAAELPMPTLHLSPASEAAYVRAFRVLLRGCSERLSSHLEGLPPRPRALRHLLAELFSGCLAGFLPPRDVGRLALHYLHHPAQGPLLLLRIALALLLSVKGCLLQCGSVDEVDRALRVWVNHGVEAAAAAAAAAEEAALLGSSSSSSSELAPPLPGTAYTYSWESLLEAMDGKGSPSILPGVLPGLLVSCLRGKGGEEGSSSSSSSSSNSSVVGGGEAAAAAAVAALAAAASAAAWHNPVLLGELPVHLQAVLCARAERLVAEGGSSSSSGRGTAAASTLALMDAATAAEILALTRTRVMSSDFSRGAAAAHSEGDSSSGSSSALLPLWPLSCLPTTGSLLALLPQAASLCNWQLAYSSDRAVGQRRAGGAVAQLLAAATARPVLLFLMLQLEGGATTMAAAAAAAAAGASGTGSAITRPVICIYAHGGLPAAAGQQQQQQQQQQPPFAWRAASPGDSAFQFLPDLSVLHWDQPSISGAGAGSGSGSGGVGAGAAAGEADGGASAGSAAAAAAAGALAALDASRFLMTAQRAVEAAPSSVQAAPAAAVALFGQGGEGGHCTGSHLVLWDEEDSPQEQPLQQEGEGEGEEGRAALRAAVCSAAATPAFLSLIGVPMPQRLLAQCLGGSGEGTGRGPSWLVQPGQPNAAATAAAAFSAPQRVDILAIEAYHLQAAEVALA